MVQGVPDTPILRVDVTRKFFEEVVPGKLSRAPVGVVKSRHTRRAGAYSAGNLYMADDHFDLGVGDARMNATLSLHSVCWVDNGQSVVVGTACNDVYKVCLKQLNIDNDSNKIKKLGNSESEAKNVVLLQSGHVGSVVNISICAKRRVFATVAFDGTLRLWHLDRKELVNARVWFEGEDGKQQTPSCCNFSDDGMYACMYVCMCVCVRAV